MRPGPIRRLSGAVGLVALAPVAYRLATGGMTPADAATRALVTLVAIVLLGRLLTAWLGQVAAGYDPSTTQRNAHRPPGASDTPSES